MKVKTRPKNKVKRQEPVYECEICGASSVKPQQCCGEPMERKDRSIPEDYLVE